MKDRTFAIGFGVALVVALVVMIAGGYLLHRIGQ